LATICSAAWAGGDHRLPERARRIVGSESACPTIRNGIGQPVLRFEDPKLLRGQGRYINDVNLPGDCPDLLMAVYQGVIEKFACKAPWQKALTVPHLRHAAATMLERRGGSGPWGFKLPECMFLVPELLRRHGLVMAATTSSLVWGLWHFPLLIPLGSETPMVFAMGCFLVMVLSIGFACAWLRQRSGSLWPAVVVHSVHNALMYAFFDALTVPVGEAGKFAVGESGFACALAYAVAAVWFIRDARRHGP